MRLFRLSERTGVRLLVLYLCGWMAAPLSLGYAQATPKAVTTRIVETTRLPHDLGTKIAEVTDLATNVTTTSITGGTRPGSGTNLFHSFDFFTVGSKDIAHFQNDMMLPTTNIIARVIGDAAGLRQASTIDGILRTNNPLNAADPLNFGTANLYLVNPAGIIFGQNAQLDLKGSFAATTADYLKMSDGAIFHTDPVQPSVLSMASVNAFGFTNPRPVAISVQGNVNEATLVVSAGQTLSLIGGDINILGSDNGISTTTSRTVSVPSGRVNLASVASPGEVVPNAEGEPPSLAVGSFQQLGTVNIGPDASVDVEGDPGGMIFIRAGHLHLDQSTLTASTRGAASHAGTAIDVEVTGEVSLTAGPLMGAEFGASTFGSGNAGNVRIVADNLELIGIPTLNAAANIGSRSFSTAPDGGDGGIIDITANRVLLRDAAFINTFTRGGGNAGSINLQTGRLEILGGLVPNQSGAFIGTNTFGSGNAGSLDVSAQTVRMVGGQGFTGLTSQVSTGGTGNASTLRVTADTIEVLNGAQISSGVFTGSGKGGDIEIAADTLLISGLDPRGFAAGLFSSLNFPSTGTAGNIRVITTGDLTVANGGQINSFSGSFGNSGHIDLQARNLSVTDDGAIISTNFGAGLGGNISIQADSVRLSGPGGLNRFHGIFALGGFVAQRAGNISITTDSLDVLDGALISARTSGIGPAGDIDITADRLLIAGADPASPSAPFDGIESGIVASALAFQPRPDLATGNGGSITLNVETIEMRNQDRIQARSTGAGDAGRVQIDATTLSISSGAMISVESTGMGDAGNISIDAGQVSITGAATSSDPFGADLTGLSARTVTGQGGALSVTADNLAVVDKGFITSSTAGNGGAGSINLQLANALSVTSGGAISASTSGAGAGGSITISADHVLVSGAGQFNSLTDQGASVISSQTLTGGGNAGSIAITGTLVDILDGAKISADTFGTGQGGNITIDADQVRVAGINQNLRNALSQIPDISPLTLDRSPRASVLATTSGSIIGEAATGNGGSVTIEAGTVNVRDGGLISAETTSRGAGGAINIKANQMSLTNGGLIAAGSSVLANAGDAGSVTVTAQTLTMTDSTISTNTESEGDAGIINVATTGNTLTVNNGSTISSSTSGSGSAGQVFITAPALVMDDGFILTEAQTGSTGNAGTIEVAVTNGTLTGGSRIDSRTRGPGDGGSVTVTADESLSLREGSRLVALTLGSGNAGQVVVTTPTLTLEESAFILASTGGVGNGGSITVNVENATLGNGSDVIAQTVGLAGHGGDVTIQGLGGPGTRARRLEIRGTEDSATISAASFGSGDAGSLSIFSDTVILQGGAPSFVGLSAQVSSLSQGAASAGDLVVRAGKLEVLDGANINAGVFGASGHGGDIDITADSILISGRSSDGFSAGIFASSEFRARGNAGNISVVSKDLTLDNFGMISAFSNTIGNAGTIDIRTGNLTATNGAFITSTNFGAGSGGNVAVTADRILLQGPTTPSQAFTTPGIFSLGGVFSTRAGDITLKTGSLDILDGAQIIARTNGPGPGGTVDITADRVTIGGSDPLLLMPEGTASGIYAGTRVFGNFTAQATGRGGNINLKTSTLNLSNKGTIEALSDSTGNAGSVSIRTGSLMMTGGAEITAEARRQGDAGSIVIEGLASSADSVSLTNSAILTSAAGTGAGGSIDIDATTLTLDHSTISASVNDVPVNGDPALGVGNITLRSPTLGMTGGGITAETTGSRNAGNIALTVGALTATAGAALSSSSTGMATGNAGSITIQGPASPADSVTLTNSSVLTKAEGTGAGGAILIDASSIDLNGATVSASVKDGLAVC